MTDEKDIDTGKKQATELFNNAHGWPRAPSECDYLLKAGLSTKSHLSDERFNKLYHGKFEQTCSTKIPGVRKDSEYWEKRGIDAGKEEWIRLCSRAKSEEMSMLVDNAQINKEPPECQFMNDASMAWLKKYKESLSWYRKIKLFLQKRNS